MWRRATGTPMLSATASISSLKSQLSEQVSSFKPQSHVQVQARSLTLETCNLIDQTPNSFGSHCSPSSFGGAMYPSSADEATTAGLARYPSPPTPIRFCQLRLNDVIARCPFCSASGPCPKQGPHHDCRI